MAIFSNNLIYDVLKLSELETLPLPYIFDVGLKWILQ